MSSGWSDMSRALCSCIRLRRRVEVDVSYDNAVRSQVVDVILQVVHLIRGHVVECNGIITHTVLTLK